MKKDYAQYLIDKTLSDYDTISDHFSNTRGFIWKDLEFIKNHILEGDRVLDLGCGNGRLTELLKYSNIEYVGIDGSQKLIKLAKEKYPNSKFIQGNVLKLPFEDNSFDKVISIAVLHHIPSEELRVQFFKEIKRILKPNSKLILTVWNFWPSLFNLMEGNKFDKRFLRLHLKYFLLKLFVKSKLDFFDIFYPWKNQEKKVLTERYVHCCTKIGIKSYSKKVGLKTEKIGFSEKNRNIVLIAKT